MSGEWWEKESLVKFECPSAFLLSGPSNSGKSVLMMKILKHARDMFTVPPVQIMYCYNKWQADLFDSVSGVEFHKDLPSESELKEFCKDRRHRLIIFDDLLSQIIDNKFVLDLFCVGSHHDVLSPFLITQNLFFKSATMRTISLNCHYFILLKNRRDGQQINTLARQMYPHNSKFVVSAYNEATSSPFGYLIIDVSSHSNDLYRLRTNCFPSEVPIVYLPLK